jgi:L-amino acid N-acyltransferase
LKDIQQQNSIALRDAQKSDLAAIIEIYNESVANSTATFEQMTATTENRTEWFEIHGKSHHPLIVAESPDRKIQGYCSLSQFQKNTGYRATAELSIYVDKNCRRRGVATLLMNEILGRAKGLGFHAIISSISSENEASIVLHEKFGFKKVGHLKEVGFKFSRWHDTSYYELIL